MLVVFNSKNYYIEKANNKIVNEQTLCYNLKIKATDDIPQTRLS